MRVLIISALLACVSGAPSGLLPVPVHVPIAYAVASPRLTVVPTISPGDLQAAAIDAQVKISDEAQLIADQARELAEQAVENQNEGVSEANDLTKERSEEALWAAEEKKWQALNEAQIAEAKLAASIADNAAKLAQSYTAGIIPSMAPAEKAEAGIAVEAPSNVKSAESDKSEAVSEAKAEEKDAVVKSAEEKPAEKSAEEGKKEPVATDLNSAIEEALKAQNQALKAYNSAILPAGVAVAPSLHAGLAVAPAAAISYQSVAPFAYQAAYRAFPVPVPQAPVKFYSPIIANAW